MLLLVFVNFMFANIAFVHYHKLPGGCTVVHSHPFGSDTGHAHTAKELNLVSYFNCTASSADAPSPAPTFIAPTHYTLIECPTAVVTTCEIRLSAKLRGPPQC